MNDVPNNLKACILAPVHADCIAAEIDAQAVGLNAVAYRGRFSEGEDANCWNSDADLAQAIGLSVVAAVCPACNMQANCLASGYLGTLDRARKAQVVIATHSRASHAGIDSLIAGRHYLSFQEDPTGVLRPVADVTESDVEKVAGVLDKALNDPVLMKLFDVRTKDGEEESEERHAERKERKNRLYLFTAHLADVVDGIVKAMREAEKTVEWKPGIPIDKPAGLESLLFRFTVLSRASFDGSPWRVLLACATGEIASAGIIADTLFAKGGKQVLAKRLLGVWNNVPSITTATVWFSDSTLDLPTLEFITGRRVHDGTPCGRQAMRRKAIQLPKDVTRRTSAKTVQNVLRGVLADRPNFNRVGVIGHSTHKDAIEKLGPPFGDRIQRVSYFGSGLDRSSNVWHQECDLLVIVGTPRLPPGAIRSYLFQVGKVGAACRDAEWKSYFWTGRTEAGEDVRIKAVGYPEDDDWRRAHRNLVRSTLVQAAGRGRGILAEGIEVVVVSTEECGLPLSDADSETVSNTEAMILAAMGSASAGNPKEYYLGFPALKTVELAISLGLSMRRVQSLLAGLEARGIVAKVGKRSGWRLVATATQPASTETTA